MAEQPDAAMKMCLSVIRLFNLSGGTGLSVSLTLANLPDLGLVHLHVPRQPKIFPSQTKYFSICAIYTSIILVGDTNLQIGSWGGGENSKMGLILETHELINREKFKLDTKEGAELLNA